MEPAPSHMRTRSRQLYIAATLSLGLGSLLELFVPPDVVHAHPWIHGVIGFFFGFSLVAYVSAFRGWGTARNDRA